MRRRRFALAALLVLLGAIAAAVVVTTRPPGGPRPGGPSSGHGVGTTGHAVEHAFASRGVGLTRVASMPRLCNASTRASSCTYLRIFPGSTKPVYYAPQSGGHDFAVVVFNVPADARSVAKLFGRGPPRAYRISVRGSAVLVYATSSARLTQLRAALAGVR